MISTVVFDFYFFFITILYTKNMKKRKKEKYFLIAGLGGLNYIEENKFFFKKEFNVEFINIIDKKQKKDKSIKDRKKVFKDIIFTDFSDHKNIFKSILNIKNNVVAIEAYGDAGIKYLEKIKSFFPNLIGPSVPSLKWSNNKNLMREFFEIYDKKITPKFLVVSEYNKENVDLIEKKIKYPLILKPTNMASSKMVTKVYHREELEKALQKILKKGGFLQTLRYDFFGNKKDFKGVKVVAEEFMEGKMYSLDGLVDMNKNIIFYPPVYVKTGKEIGFDDFFGYRRTLPTLVKEEKIEKMNDIARKSIEALSLYGTHFHLELMETEDGFKIIEIGTRIGGHREYMYKESFGYSIAKNALLMKIGEKIKKPNNKKIKYTSVLHIFAEKEGKIKKISGFKKIEKLKSIDSISQLKKAGDSVKFAKNGGVAVFKIMLSNEERGELFGDIRKIEENLKIVT